jgi:hypothetical protein
MYISYLYCTHQGLKGLTRCLPLRSWPSRRKAIRRRPFSARSSPMFLLVPSPSACCDDSRESWSVIGVVRAAPGWINLPQLYFHTGGVLHGGVSELMTSCVCRFLGLAALSFLDGIVVAEAAIPSGVYVLLLCPCCYGVGSDVMVEHGGCLVQEYGQTVVCAGDRWKMVYHVLGLWMKAHRFDFLPRCRSRAGVSWSSIACSGTCLSTVLVLLKANYFGVLKSCWLAMKPHQARVMWWCVFRPFGSRFDGVKGGGYALVFCIGLSYLLSSVRSVCTCLII